MKTLYVGYLLTTKHCNNDILLCILLFTATNAKHTKTTILFELKYVIVKVNGSSQHCMAKQG